MRASSGVQKGTRSDLTDRSAHGVQMGQAAKAPSRQTVNSRRTDMCRSATGREDRCRLNSGAATEIVRLADRHTIVAQDVISGHHVEREVRDRIAEQIAKRLELAVVLFGPAA